MNDLTNFASHQAVKRAFHDDQVLQNELTRTIERYREVNLRHFNAWEINDMRRHYSALDAIPALIQMLNEEIDIIRRQGPRPAPWWDLVG